MIRALSRFQGEPLDPPRHDGKICAGMLLDKMVVTNLQIRKMTAGREQLHRDDRDPAESHSDSLLSPWIRGRVYSGVQTHVLQFLGFQYLIVRSGKL